MGDRQIKMESEKAEHFDVLMGKYCSFKASPHFTCRQNQFERQYF